MSIELAPLLSLAPSLVSVRPKCMAMVRLFLAIHSEHRRNPNFDFAAKSVSMLFVSYGSEMKDNGQKLDISFAGRFTSSAISACFAEICTISLDTAKVRLQLQKNVVSDDVAALPKYKGLLGTVATIGREEGLAALWKGIVPGLHRQCIYGGLRIGLYEPIKTYLVGPDHVGDIPLSAKIIAGLSSGAIAITVANPTDLVKDFIIIIYIY